MRVRAYTLTLAAGLAVSLLFAPGATGQEKAKSSKAAAKAAAPSQPTPRMANGKPDFGGVWQTPRMADITQDSACCKGVGELPFTAWGKHEWETYDTTVQGDYTGACLPFGLLRSVGGPHPVQIIQNDKYIAMLYEQNSWFHVTPIGKPHQKDPDPSWYGDSVARWEGDTLVIDTIAFNGKTKIDTIGHPISDQLHTIERFERPVFDRIDYSITMEDPKTFTRKIESKRSWKLHPEWEIMEYSCEENNKDVSEGLIKAPKP